MTYMVANFDVGDYDKWKREVLDADPAGRKQAAKGHLISRSVENPSDIFIRVEFASVDDARSFRERLMGSSALDNVNVKTPPTIVEVADEETY